MAAMAWPGFPPMSMGAARLSSCPLCFPAKKSKPQLRQGRSGFVRASLDRVLVPSPERVEPGCPYFSRCGGCHYQHIDYAAQLRYKAEILRETLRRTAKLDLQQDIVLHSAEPWGYRNRTRMHVHHQPQFALGYFRHNSHALLPVESCPISSPLINQAIAAVWTLGREKLASRGRARPAVLRQPRRHKILLEAYVRPGSDAQELQPFAARLHSALPQIAGVVVFATSSVEDESRLHAPAHIGSFGKIAGHRRTIFSCTTLWEPTTGSAPAPSFRPTAFSSTSWSKSP